MLRLGVPVTAVREVLAGIEDTDEGRMYREFPIALLRAAMPEVVGHGDRDDKEKPVIFELDEEEFEVSGLGSYC